MLAQVKRIHLWPYTMQFSAQTKLLRYRHRRHCAAAVVVVPCRRENLFLVQFIYFFPGCDVYCSAVFFIIIIIVISIIIRIHSLEPYILHSQRQCLLGKHTRCSNKSMLQKSCCSDFFLLCCCCRRCRRCCLLVLLLLVFVFVHHSVFYLVCLGETHTG